MIKPKTFNIYENEKSTGSNHTKKYKTGVYLRLSKEDALSGVSASIENQGKIIETYLTDNSHEFEWVDTYIDDGITGVCDDRVSFQRMIDDCKRKRINCVIVKDGSRFARNYADCEYYVEEFFLLHKIRFICLDNPRVDSVANPGSVSGMQFHFTNYFNEYFIKQTSEKINQVFADKRRRGDFIGSFAPYGYIKDPENKHRLIIDEEAAEVVRKIFGLFVHDGLSLRQIALRLNGIGIPTRLQYQRSKGSKVAAAFNPLSYAWDYVSVKRIMSDERYIGHMVQGKTAKVSYKVKKFVHKPKEEWVTVRNTHEAIVSEEIFLKAQTLMVRPSRVTRAGEKSNYSGLLFCSKCGHTLTRKKGIRGGYAYVCKFHNETKRCEPLHITEKALDERVLYAIRTQIACIVDMERIFEDIDLSVSHVNDSLILKSSIAAYEKEKEKLVNRSHKLYDDYADGIIDRALFDSRRIRLKEEIAVNEKKITGLTKEIKKTLDVKVLSTDYIKRFKEFETIEGINRKLLVSLVDKILAENLIRPASSKQRQIKKVTVVFNFIDEAIVLKTLAGEN